MRLVATLMLALASAATMTGTTTPTMVSALEAIPMFAWM
jgi:hypothetical protein